MIKNPNNKNPQAVALGRLGGLQSAKNKDNLLKRAKRMNEVMRARRLEKASM